MFFSSKTKLVFLTSSSKNASSFISFSKDFIGLFSYIIASVLALFCFCMKLFSVSSFITLFEFPYSFYYSLSIKCFYFIIWFLYIFLKIIFLLEKILL